MLEVPGFSRLNLVYKKAKLIHTEGTEETMPEWSGATSWCEPADLALSVDLLISHEYQYFAEELGRTPWNP